MREWAARNQIWETGRRVARTPSAHPVVGLQRTVGNRAVNALLARRGVAGRGPQDLLPEEDEPGSRAARFELPEGVHAHHGSPADLGAEAFTRGQDVHLPPGPDEELLDHELAHVRQARVGRF